jgi:hypothetical protein
MRIPTAGTARPRVTSFGGAWLLLSGGRMFNQGRNDLGDIAMGGTVIYTPLLNILH